MFSHDFAVDVDDYDDDDDDDVDDDFGVIKLGLFCLSQPRPDLTHRRVER